MPRPQRPYHPRNVPVDAHQERLHPLYPTWANMLARCYCENDPSFENYGGRGIDVDPRWWHFRFFAADMGERPPNLTIERKDNDRGYSHANCVWGTRSEQSRNRRKFKNNASGHTGIRKVGERYRVRIDHEKIRYMLGYFATVGEALLARADARNRIESGMLPTAAPDTVWATSTSGVRGVTPHKEGGFIVRVTVDGERKYLGYFKTLEEAIDAKRRANPS